MSSGCADPSRFLPLWAPTSRPATGTAVEQHCHLREVLEIGLLQSVWCHWISPKEISFSRLTVSDLEKLGPFYLSSSAY